MKAFFSKRKNVALVILGALCVLINLISRSASFVEIFYTNGIYPFISKGLRMSFAKIPFSLGDVLYTTFSLFILFRLFRFFRKLFTRKIDRQYLSKSAYTILFTIFIGYFLFNILWGINYNREGISQQLQLSHTKTYTTKQLNDLTKDLVVKANANRILLGEKINYPNDQTVFNEAVQSYKNVALQYPFLHYDVASIKVPVYNILGSYLGYTGYYNPFTGEAQVVTDVPKFSLPYVTCHEMAHQIGYATEDEANFTGYLAASNSFDPLFKYSTYLDLYQYANYELYFRDSALAKKNYASLDTLVKSDLYEMRNFIKEHKNPAEKLLSALYNQYLKANKQPQGIETYSEVTAWLIAYKNKYGKL
ncbi:MAG TPA: DUF3810 domain-containing protein [Arachidicoccus sp.]